MLSTIATPKAQPITPSASALLDDQPDDGAVRRPIGFNVAIGFSFSIVIV
jgi:hypothetical protein